MMRQSAPDIGGSVLPPKSASVPTQREAAGTHGPRPISSPSAPVGVRSPNRHDNVIGMKIRELRRAKLITQQNLAQMVGVTGAQLHRYEAGTTRVAASRLIAIAQSLGVSAEVLMGTRNMSVATRQSADTAALISDGGEVVELLQLYMSISNPKDQSAVMEIAKMFAGGSDR